MLIIKFLRFISGYVSFTAYGGFPERLVNLCTKNRIPLWNMKSFNKYITADTTIKGYKAIREPARRSGVRVRISAKHGLPFFLSKNRQRKGIAVGLAAAVVVVSFLSTMVWSISVSGNKTLTTQQVLSAFSEVGVKIGARSSSISPSDAAYEAKKLLPQIAWASVNIKGSRVEIVISELTAAPEFPDESTPCNIVAREDGIIMSIEATCGTAEVKSGDAVIKGDLLISGITENLDNTYNFKTARGRAHAKVHRQISVCCKEDSFTQEAQLCERKILYILGLKIPLGFGSRLEHGFCEESYVSNGNIDLPLGIITQRAYSLGGEAYADDGLITLASAHKFVKAYRELYSSCEQVLFSEFSVYTTQDATVFSGDYECKCEIGKPLEIFVEK